LTGQLLRDAARIFAALSIPLFSAAAAHFVAPKNDLGMTYSESRGSPQQALEILINNMRVAGLVAGATILAVAVPAAGCGLTWPLAAVAVLYVALLAAVLLALARAASRVRPDKIRRPGRRIANPSLTATMSGRMVAALQSAGSRGRGL